MLGAWKNIKQKIFPHTLYGRSLMIIVVPILLLQMIVAYIFINRHLDSMSDKLVFALAGEIDMITEQVRQAGSQEDIGRIIRHASTGLGLRLNIDPPKEAGKPPRRPVNLMWYSAESKLQKALRERISESFTITPYPDGRRFEVSIRLDDGRTLQYICYNNRLISPTTYIFILWLIGSSIVLMAIAVIFMRNQIRPIHRLAIAAEKLGKGQDVGSFKLGGAREVRQAATAFLDMRDRIRRQIEQRTAMLAGVSHDLRTPLTRMKLQLAMMKGSAENGNLRQDLDEMEKMLEGYLTFARGEGNEGTEMTDMKSMLERIVSNARRQGCDVQASFTDRLMVRVRPMAVERALANVVSNACKYAKHVWVSAREQAEALEIFVDDDGPGIPQEQREEVFKPFYRLEKSRNPKTGGVGLGLSIAQDIVHSHGGEIFLEESNRGGLRVVIRLPL
ncbi:MAG: HAMP domain-containing protein [Alphaproteobacteria bacterium]|nr:HAMP domain-containing protein [Alphaproteobacteria bacterium]